MKIMKLSIGSRGLSTFARYADDATVLVTSAAAATRAAEDLRGTLVTMQSLLTVPAVPGAHKGEVFTFASVLA